MLLIQLSKFCDRIKPTPRKCLEQLYSIIPLIAENKVNALTQQLNDALTILHTEPNDVHSFVSTLEFRRKLTKDFDQIRKDYAETSAFYTLISDNKITTSEDSIVSFRALAPLIGNLEALIISTKEDEENKIQKWKPSLQNLLVNVRKELLDIHYKTNDAKVLDKDSNPDEVIKYLINCQNEVNELSKRCEQIQSYQKSLQLKVSPIDELTETSVDLDNKLLLWKSHKEWKELITKWNPTPFKSIKIEEFNDGIQKFTRIASQLSTSLPEHPLVPIFKSSVFKYTEILPVIIALSNPCLTSIHWNKIERITGVTKLQETNYPLIYLIDKQFSSYSEAIESISNDASNETSLLKMLREIENTWDKIDLQIIPHKEKKDFYLIGGIDEITETLEETQVQLSTIRSSRYVGAIKTQVDDLSKSMNLLGKCLENISVFQIAFNSLSKIFSSSDIQRELATQSKELFVIERQFKTWGQHARDSPRAFKLCSNPKVLQLFDGWLESIEKIQKDLEEFLQKKRTAFPRFYFLSNENLLKIFAEARNPKAVQPFLPKLFDGIHTLEFSPNGQDILAMYSVEGEKISLSKCQSIGAIENWLNNLEKSMKLTLHHLFKDGLNAYITMSRIDWIQKHYAQVISVISQIKFAQNVEEALISSNPLESLKNLNEQMNQNLSDLSDLVRCQLPRSKRSAIVSLITLDIHSRDIIIELINENVQSLNDFCWVKRLRYYWDTDLNRICLNQANARIEYGYEYLGATSRLVVTPLTERCYLTLTSALQCYLGGSPAGPAGTGKTETVKDLSKAVGNFCVVFNCSDAVTVIQMESFFSGLSQTGAWACFDEFNRINIEVLSVIAEQVYTIQNAIASHLKTFQFSGQLIPLNPRVGIFITMNPGYAGRTELPDNLKSLFRPISMMVPDYSMIAENILYSEGFNNAKPLARKITQLYKLSSEMLSHQSHYDFGMRALKSVLIMAGKSKRKTPTLNEDIILIRAMKDSNVSKLLIDDYKLFNDIISDLFPGVEFEEETFEELTNAINQAINERGLQQSNYIINKTIQLYQIMNIRHGVMLVGQTGGGKTTSRNLLSDALDILNKPVEQVEVNPKAVTLSDLYGSYNLVTNEWKNGLVGKFFSEMSEADPNIQQWIIFDGPVDALWIENLNTVLDDNKLLSLANSDRIKMTDQMHLLFEVGDLSQASPATVSRCGMVYYQPEDLVGMGGTGKRTSARFAAFVSDIEVFELQPTKDYKINEFRNDLKTIFKIAGIQNKPIMFLLNDEQIIDESFLEDINNVLNNGEVPGLFETEEFNQLINELVPMMKKSNESIDYESLCKKFTSNIMKNLHIVLALSPIGGRFRDRCRIFPALVNCCTIDWFEPWNNEALETVANGLLKKMDSLNKFNDQIETISKLSTYGHSLVVEISEKFKHELNRIYYVTPAIYIEYFSLFNDMLKKRISEMKQKKEQLKKGIDKLAGTNNKVQEMEAELQKLTPLLEKKANETNELMEKLKVDKVKVNEAHKSISAEEEIVQQVRTKALKLASEAQADLDKAMPLLNAALSAVEDLKNRKSELAVVKTFVKPPQLVIEIMEAVCLLNGRNGDWASAKSFLAQTDFFNQLLEVHNKPIPESTLNYIRKMASDPKYSIKNVASVSESAACLFKWVTAIEKYVTERQRILPKQKRRDEAQEALNEAEKNLKEKQDELKIISDQLTNLQNQFDESQKQQIELTEKIKQCQYRLKNASLLTVALDDERIRWKENLIELSNSKKSILGDTLLIVFHIAYIGPFSYNYRSEIITKMISKTKELNLQISNNFSLENITISPATLREWQVNGLPQDLLSKQNGVLVTMSKRYPLLIDPQGQGRKWLIENNQVKTLRSDDPNYIRSIENAIRVGSSVLLEDVGEVLDPGLDFILSPKIQKKNGRISIRIGNKWVDKDPNFKLYITTKLNNPNFLPDIFNQLSVINFSVTKEGLEEQLLSDVVLHEMPELENQRSELIIEISKDQKALNELMDKILHLLFTSTGNILDNETLIATLHNAKETSKQVMSRLKQSEKTEKEITEKRSIYNNVAERGALLYFVILELPGIDSMYQYSLEFFKRIFNEVLVNTEECEDIPLKCIKYINNLTYSTYANVSRGLFDNHRLVFSFLIATRLLRTTNKITDEMWELFIRGPKEIDVEQFEKPNSNIETRIWSKICSLSKTFKGLETHINQNYNLWKPLIEEDSIKFPSPYNNLTIFEQLIIISSISKRKVSTLARNLIQDELDESYLTISNVSLEDPFNDTSNDIPLLFILSQGADPRELLERFAQQKGYSNKLKVISLGQGRGPTAVNMLKRAKTKGEWVFLQNCHLCPSFLPKLEHMIQKMSRKSSTYHKEFRLFLSSMPTNEFPIFILRNSIKVTSEPPSGIQSNINLLMNTINSKQWESGSKIRPWKKLLFSIAVFHSTIQERKRYGSLGFNKIYEWNPSDFLISIKMLRIFLTQNDDLQWDALRQMIGDVIYGGRVTDDWDRRCMNSLLDKFLCNKALEDGYYFDENKLYPTIPLFSYAQIQKFVTKNFPIEDSPSIFGFHPTALNTLNLQKSENLIDLVLAVQPNEGNSSVMQKDDETVLELINELESQLPIVITTKNAHKSLFKESYGNKMNSLTITLLQEVDRYNSLLNLIHNSLGLLKKAIKGEVLMSIELSELYHNLINKQIPKQWANISYPSQKPLIPWYKDLIKRIDFIQNWIKKGEPNVFWFSGFYFPQSFLTAILQNHSRKYSVPIDTLEFEAEIMNQNKDDFINQPEDGVYIYGLYFDGAQWDFENNCLCDCNLNNNNYVEAPVIHLIPKVDFTCPKDQYLCPVYRTAVRAGVLSTTGHSTNFVVALNIPSKEKPKKWTLRGTALLLETPF
ncbi:Dynein heavy chain family protein [Histomonas meleagridis]|uniref:Dynein heavy chain family protein n=1 Tax=Histomonas meleagridis TaxID=135588 RepID=UPI00355A81D3|nr:Dynein heavy chain family protein [Histomonas meleagridis]KAH0807044.1 Dynein heavy chain family protein [Histomonas meleagridis]